ncbi:prolactin precursor [Kryptolebias marmoratus]|uniref:Prolactin n=1 Tax=Kryptolebias marmoratus TaxID=37003 RepID=A7YKN0_KRYMA|nr:prolactin precursor [Kryptolebias marmoratus]ABK97640.1 prolactin [Kryptolebias marmoratus]
MAQSRTSGGKLFMAVVYMLATCRAVPIDDLLNRASGRSDEMYSLSTGLTKDLASHMSPLSWPAMERPALCHTSVLPTPNDKEQTLQVSESALMSLARSLLQAWAEPLVILSNHASTLPHPARINISNKIQNLQDYSKSLGDGLDVLSGKMGPEAQVVSILPYHGGTDLGHDRNSKLQKFNFLLSCFRRDSHKIDSFLKVLRCRAAKMQPELC